MRDLAAKVIAPAMKMTGFRFSKEYRWAESGWKSLVYRCVNTIMANQLAGV